MKKEDKTYVFLIGIHLIIGILIYVLPFLSKVYALSIFVFGIFYIVKNKNRNNEVLLVAAYLVGSEVFLRMTGGNLFYETAKYGVIVFIFLGFYYSGFAKIAFPYWTFLVLLIPSVVLSAFVLDFDTNIRKAIAFNISGPGCLGIAAIYTYRRPVSFDKINAILLQLGLPIVSCMAYLTIYTPNIKEVVTGTQSNFETSGGFGPNQVATVLGLGMFVFFSRVVLCSKSKWIVILNLIIAINISYRGLVTFSRGGIVTAVFMIIFLLIFVYFKSSSKGRIKINYIFILFAFALVLSWGYTSYQTGGLIDKRYANQDAAGRVKKSQLTGREEIANTEINMFLENPIFGVGVGKGAEVRKDILGETVASHDEITRMLAEHGTLGIFALLILIITPLLLLMQNKFNLYLFSFLLFWFLTINHAAMRTAAPAFVYSLALLNVHFGLSKSSIKRM